MRYVLLIDLNSFYVSVERAENSSLRNEVCAVAGSEDKRNGVILTASYQARKFGIRAGMSNKEALKLCPNLVLVPPQHDLYLRYSKKVMNILRGFHYKLEQSSIDEAWLDISDLCTSYNDAIKIAIDIKEKIYNDLGITVSVGISYCKILSKLASDIADVNDIYIIKQSELKEKVWHLPVKKLCGVGSRTEEKLEALNIFTIGDLATSDIALIKGILKKPGETLWFYSNGIDNNKINHIKSLPKSIGHAKTSEKDICTLEDAYIFLESISDDIEKRMKKYCASGKTISITIKTNDFNSFNRQKTRIISINSKDNIFNESKLLLKDNWNEQKPIRMLGITLSNLNYFEEQLCFDI